MESLGTIFLLNKKIILKKNKVEDLTLLNFKLATKLQVIKRVWYLHKEKYTDQWNREPRNKTSQTW